MPDTITKILFRRGLDVQRRTAGGTGVKFDAGQPAFCLDTKRLYVGTGTDSGGLIGGVPIGHYNHGGFSSVFGVGMGGYNATTYSTLTTQGIDAGDTLFDNGTSIMYYVSSKNPLSAVPSTDELVAYSLLGRVSGDNGILAYKNGPVAAYRLDPYFFTVNNSSGIVLNQTTTVGSNLQVNANTHGLGSLTIDGVTVLNNTITLNGGSSYASVGGTVYGDVAAYGLNITPGHSSMDWYAVYTNVRSTSSIYLTACNALQNILPFAWTYNTTTSIISTYGTSYKVGVNCLPTFTGMSVKGANTINTALSVCGSIEATGDILVYTTSDAKYKKNITPITDALMKVSQINGVSFDWDSPQKTGHDVGVIAQEIERVLPEAVIDRGEAGKAVNYEKIIPLLIEAIKVLANR